MGLAVFWVRFPFLNKPASLSTVEEIEGIKGNQYRTQLQIQRPKQESKTYKCPHYLCI